MPSYIVFRRTPSFDLEWKELSKIGHAQDDNDAWYQARWGARGLDTEVLIKRVGFWAGVRGKYDWPSSSEQGKPPYTPDERERIQEATQVGREYGLQLVKQLNGME